MYIQEYVGLCLLVVTTCRSEPGVAYTYPGAGQTGNDITDVAGLETDGISDPYWAPIASDVEERSFEKERIIDAKLTAGKFDRMQESEGKDYSARKRQKRSLFAIGAKAVKFLLTGAKPIKSQSKQWKTYEKPGTPLTAVADFFSVHPKNVVKYEYPNGVRVMEGTVGDRTIYIKSSDVMENGSPSIEIFDPKGMKVKSGYNIYNIYGQPSEKIVYKMLDQ